MRKQGQAIPPQQYPAERQWDEQYDRLQYFLETTAALRGKIETSRRFDPDQEVMFNDLADRLCIDTPLDGNYRVFRELWAAENEEQVYLATIEAPLPLLSEEQCCFAEPAVWRRPEANSPLFSGGRFSTPFPLTKCASYRIGNPKPRIRSFGGTREMATGTLYITDFKIFFDSESLSTSITFNGLANVECYSNGIEVGKTNGQSEFFQITALASEYAYMIIQELNRIR